MGRSAVGAARSGSESLGEVEGSELPAETTCGSRSAAELDAKGAA